MKTEYSLLVIDDEAIARNHVLHGIAWDKLTVNTLLEAADGETGLAMVREHHPDIVILDIRMPGMGGLGFIQALQKEPHRPQIVALSGYSDFEAARKMLSSGLVVAYLLKPVSEDQMFDAVYKCIANIEAMEKKNEMENDLRRVQASMRRSQLRRTLFSGSDPDDDAEDLLQQNQWCQVAVYFGGDARELQQACRAQRVQGIELPQHAFFCADTGGIALVFLSASNDLPNRVMRRCCELLRSYNGKIGCGRSYLSERRLNASYQEALLTCAGQNLLTHQRFSRIGEIEDLLEKERQQILPEGVAAWIRIGDRKNLISALNAAAQKMPLIASNGERPWPLAVHVAQLIDAMFTERKEELNLVDILAAKTVPELMRLLEQIMRQNNEEGSGDGRNRKAQLVDEVRVYMQENLAEHVTLESAARVASINSSYLSRIFSEVTGQGFADYLAEIRVEKARGLLANRRLKIYEVAELVGYHNAKHFMRVFKKLEGVTPTEYREKLFSFRGV